MDAFEDADLERLIDDVGERLGYAVGGHASCCAAPAGMLGPIASERPHAGSRSLAGYGAVLSTVRRGRAVVPRSLTRMQALRAGALAAAVVGPRPALPALAADDALGVELALDGALDRRAAAASAGGGAPEVLRAPRRFDLAGLVWARGSHAEAQLRASARRPLDPLGDAARPRRPRTRPRPAAGRHRPGLRRRRRRIPAPAARRAARAARPLRARPADRPPGHATQPALRGRRARAAQAGAPPRSSRAARGAATASRRASRRSTARSSWRSSTTR